jgi:hypothetical protein
MAELRLFRLTTKSCSWYTGSQATDRSLAIKGENRQEMLKYSDKWMRAQTPSGTDQEKEDQRRFVEDQLNQETNKILNAYSDEPSFRRQLIMRLAEKELMNDRVSSN